MSPDIASQLDTSPTVRMIQCCWFWLLFFTQIYAITFVQGFKVRILKRKHNIPNLHRILPVHIFSQLVNGMTSYSTATSEKIQLLLLVWEQTLLLLWWTKGAFFNTVQAVHHATIPFTPNYRHLPGKGKEHHILNRLHLRICVWGGRVLPYLSQNHNLIQVC